MVLDLAATGAVVLLPPLACALECLLECAAPSLQSAGSVLQHAKCIPHIPLQVRTVTLPTGAEASSRRLAPLLSTLPLELRPDMEAFIAATYAVSSCMQAWPLPCWQHACCPAMFCLPAPRRSHLTLYCCTIVLPAPCRCTSTSTSPCWR